MSILQGLLEIAVFMVFHGAQSLGQLAFYVPPAYLGFVIRVG